MNVFLLWHVHELDARKENSKLIGVYSTRESAVTALKRAVQLPGFRDVPDGFLIDRYEVDRDEWREGYTTVNSGNGLLPG